MPEASPLPVTERTRHRRLREQGSIERRDLVDILTAGVICHLGVVIDGYPMVVPAGIPLPPHIAALARRPVGRRDEPLAGGAAS